jgi:hypothetical protein
VRDGKRHSASERKEARVGIWMQMTRPSAVLVEDGPLSVCNARYICYEVRSASLEQRDSTVRYSTLEASLLNVSVSLPYATQRIPEAHGQKYCSTRHPNLTLLNRSR